MKTKKKFHIPHFFTNSQGNISLGALISLLVETSFYQASDVEKNIDTKNKNWFIYRWMIEIKKNIKANDNIEISTIPVGFYKFYAYRDFFVEDNNKTLIKANSIFMLYDDSKNRAIKIPEDYIKAYDSKKVLIKEQKLKRKKEYKNKKSILLRYSDIDTNNHVNNAKYFEFLEDILKERADKIKTIDLIYKNQIKYDDNPVIYYDQSDNFFEFEIRSDQILNTYGRLEFNV